ncbi:MAG: 4Fe-4S dicluster domain-containing protein [Anaerolineae bacterium]|nr:4Fe-4S dicluster domain-containing protein [Anaerolineae bacterium]
MAYVIVSTCESCGECVEVCPTESIYNIKDNAAWPTHYINPETCIDCGACVAVCPTESIYYEDDVPAEYEADIEKNEAFYAEGPGADLI